MANMDATTSGGLATGTLTAQAQRLAVSPFTESGTLIFNADKVVYFYDSFVNIISIHFM